MPEPSLSEVHADLVGRFEHDKRLRSVEQEVYALKTLPAEVQRMEGRLTQSAADDKAEILNAIASVKAEASSSSRNTWAMIAAAAAAITAVIAIVALSQGSVL